MKESQRFNTDNTVVDQEQLLLQQWNKDLEGIDFSLEPFLKRCKQEEEEQAKLDQLLKDMLILLNSPCTYSLVSYSLEDNIHPMSTSSSYNMQHEGNMKPTCTNERLTSYNNGNELSQTVRYSNAGNSTVYSFSHVNTSKPVEEQHAIVNRKRTSVRKEKKARNNNTVPSSVEQHPKNYIIHVEHPEKPKEHKKRGRPCKTQEVNTNGIVFLSNYFEEMKSC
ncbi:hypothetical protein ABK040_000381 [Willaertia magna]